MEEEKIDRVGLNNQFMKCNEVKEGQRDKIFNIDTHSHKNKRMPPLSMPQMNGLAQFEAN